MGFCETGACKEYQLESVALGKRFNNRGTFIDKVFESDKRTWVDRAYSVR